MNRYLVGVSGGIDSMCLFHYLNKTNNILYCVHINHHTRGSENVLEQDLVLQTCKLYGVECFLFDFHYNNKVGNFHNCARDFRLNCYKQLIQEYNLDGVCLGHHRDDLVENILMNPLKVGSKLFLETSVINGIKIIRPFISQFKEQIKAYQKENEVKYLEDSSNKEIKYKRNKIRMQISNLLKVQKEDLINQEIMRINHCKTNNEFVDMDEPQKQYYLYNLLKKDTASNVSLKFIDSVIKSYTLSGNKEFYLPNNRMLLLSYGKFKVIKRAKKSKELEKITKKGYNSFNGITFYAESVYKVRVRQNNDYVIINGIKKKLNRYLIEKKIPSHIRDIIPFMVIDNNYVQMVKMEELL